MKKIHVSNKFHRRALTIIFVLQIFVGIALKHENLGPTVSSFNPCSSLPCVVIENSFNAYNIVVRNKTGPVFLEFN